MDHGETPAPSPTLLRPPGAGRLDPSIQYDYLRRQDRERFALTVEQAARRLNGRAPEAELDPVLEHHASDVAGVCLTVACAVVDEDDPGATRTALDLDRRWVARVPDRRRGRVRPSGAT
jgi:hypothetical protein